MANNQPKFKIGQEVWCVCTHGRDTVDSVIIAGIWSYHGEHSDYFLYDVAGYDDYDNPERRDNVPENHLLETEDEAWLLLRSHIRGDLASARHEVSVVESRLRCIEEILTKRGIKE